MKVIIIGGNAAGMSAAAKLKRVEPTTQVIVYEQLSYISFGACGLPYYVGGFFEEESRMFARTPEAARQAGIELQTEHAVLSILPEQKKVRVRDLKTNEEKEDSYDKLMIATGASAIVPPIQNIGLGKVHTLRSMEDGQKLTQIMSDEQVKRVAVVGAGFIGLEVVEAAMKRGKEVYVFQLEERVLKDVFDQEVTSIIEEELRQEGVNLYLNSKVVALKGEKAVTHIRTEDQEIPIDAVVLATGVRPNTGFAKESGLKMLDNGAIVIDRYGKTSIEDIYAAGDCATVPHLLSPVPTYIPLATSANKLGRIIGENLAGASIAFEGTLGSSCLKVLNMEAGRTGLSEEEARKLGKDYKVVWITDKNHTDYYPGQEDLSVKIIYERSSKVMIGGQVIGRSGAVLRTDVLATAIYSQLTTQQLGMMDLCYAPPFARTWDALNIAGNVAK